MSPTPGAPTSIAQRYRFDRVIGRGGMGTVWQATDLRLGRTVAIKDVLLPLHASDDERHAAQARLMREAHAAARSTDPAVVTVHDVIEEQERLYLVMEYVDAPSLESVVAERGPLPPAEVATLGARIAGALATAHERGVIHRDVKPSNVLVPNGASSVKLVDFGIAAVADAPSITASGATVGSPSYMSPEQAEGQPATTASDVFSLGSTLYFAVEGAGPFHQSTSLATLAAVVSQAPRAPTRAGPLEPLLLEMIDKEPARRPAVSDVQRRLAAVAPEPEPKPAPADDPDTRDDPSGTDTRVVDALQDRPTAAPPPAGDEKRRRWRLLAGAGVVVAVLVAVGLAVIARGGDDAAGAGLIPYVDPQGGFQLLVPEDAAVTVDEDRRFTEIASGDARITVEWVDGRDGQVELMRRQEQTLSALPQFHAFTVEEQRFGDFFGMFGEFEFASEENPDELVHSTGRTFAVSEFTFALFFQAPADQFDALEGDVFSAVEASFHPIIG
jgi:hypothetical protein